MTNNNIMDIKKQPKPWYIRYRYHLLGGTALSAILLYAVVLLFTSGQKKVSVEELEIATVELVPFMEYVDVEGLVLPIQTIQVNAMESGFVERVVAEEGAMLSPGDTVLVLSNPELYHSIDDEHDAWNNSLRNYREQEIEMTQKTITLRQQTLDAEHQMASLEKSLRQSREEYRMGVKSKAELEVAEEDYEYQRQKVQLQMQNLRHDSVATRLKREMIEANRKEADKKLARMTDRTRQLVVRAPVGGQLSYVGVTQGQQVTAGTSIGQIKVMSQFKLQVSLAEYYIDRVTTGLPASIEDGGHKYPLKVSRVVPEVKDRKFVCELTFASDTPQNIRLGKSYRVLLELGKPEQALVVPNGDFYRSTNGYWIFRLSADGKKAQRVNITVGRQNPRQYEITSGLKAGDRVIVGGYAKIAGNDELVLQ